MFALRCLSAGLAICLMVLAEGATAAPAPSGLVIAVVQQAQVNGQTGQRTLQPEAPVFSGDRIITGSIGEAQVRFRDNTKLVVGPSSTMIIDAFVFNDDNSARKISINAVRGAFRFFTGNSRKDAYSITTPTATIGVRGTIFDFNVDRAGTLRLVNFEGATRICDRTIDPATKKPRCVETRQNCGLTVLRRNDKLQNITDRAERNRQFASYFRYVNNQRRLLPDFRVDVSGCGNTALDMTPTSGGSTPPPPPPPPPPPRVVNKKTSPRDKMARRLGGWWV
jgi:hypothetical protein